MQDNVVINDVKVPTTIEDGIRYYPISYVGDKLLFRIFKFTDLKKQGYEYCCKKFIINFGDKNIQETYCISYVERSNNTRVNDYRDRVEEKIEKYDELNWLGKVYVYPEDLKENYKGLEERLSVIN